MPSKAQPSRKSQPSHKAASANPLGFVRAGCFESPAPLSGRRWCVPKLKSGQPSYSPTTSSPLIPSTNIVSVAFPPITSLQISSANVMSVAFYLRFCYRCPLPALCLCCFPYDIAPDTLHGPCVSIVMGSTCIYRFAHISYLKEQTTW